MINKQKAFIQHQHIWTVFRFGFNDSFYPWWLRNRTFRTVYRNKSRILFLSQSHTRNEYSIKICYCASQAFSICLLNSWICYPFAEPNNKQWARMLIEPFCFYYDNSNDEPRKKHTHKFENRMKWTSKCNENVVCLQAIITSYNHIHSILITLSLVVK